MRARLLSALVGMGLLVGCTGRPVEGEPPTSGIRSHAVTGAGFTTVDPSDGLSSDTCLNGNPGVNCNIYTDKKFVWLNGGPSPAQPGAGTYFFAVLVPGGQPDPNDYSAKNLSSPNDTYQNRTFTINADGSVSYGGTHDFIAPKIRLAPYDDTTNPGGVYIMAICSLAKGYPVAPKDCKYDAFKVKATDETPSVDLVVTKDATATFTRTYGWSIEKSVDQTKVKQVGGSAIFNYTVAVTHDSGTDSGWQVAGSIQVDNFNTFDIAGVNVTDAIADPNATCTVSGGSNVTVPGNGGSVVLTYVCSYAAAPTSSNVNTATAIWPSSYGTPSTSASFSLAFSFPGAPTTEVNACTTVTDTFDGTPTTLGSPCVTDPTNPTLYQYAKTIAIPQWNCRSYTNTAALSTGGDASQTVTVCGPAHTGALTMGFWQNKNGQGIIKTGASISGVCTSGTWLRQYAPFQDLSATATCTQVAAYVYGLIKAASAAGATMNAMLKPQMLATALDVYFSAPALGGNKIGAPGPVGDVAIDLTKVCHNIGVCSVYENDSGAFGGATSMTVSQLLAYAAAQSDVGGIFWYGNVKSLQEEAKDVFDAINNQVAFGAP
jgi:hypothetical protein